MIHNSLQSLLLVIMLFNKGCYTPFLNLVPHSCIVDVEAAMREDEVAAGSSVEVP